MGRCIPAGAETLLGGDVQLQCLPQIVVLGTPISLQDLQGISKAFKARPAKRDFSLKMGVTTGTPVSCSGMLKGKLPGSAPALAQPEPAQPLAPELPASRSCPITHPKSLLPQRRSTEHDEEHPWCRADMHHHSGAHPHPLSPAGICLGKDPHLTDPNLESSSHILARSAVPQSSPHAWQRPCFGDARPQTTPQGGC